MGEKYWLQNFETGLDRLRVHFHTKAGEVETITIIQYEAYIGGKWRAIVRFDETHGFFHRDVLSPSGEQEKIIEPEMDKGKALTEAISNIKHNWRSYRKT